ncbi:fibronectin type III domain-containing protein, partial [archaeon]
DNIATADAGTSTAGVANAAIVRLGVDAAAAACTGPQVVSGLVQGVPYYMRVTAFNQEGYGDSVAAVSARGLPYQAPMRPPGRPTSVTLTVKSGTELRATWNAPSDTGGDAVTAYRVAYGTGLDASTGALLGAQTVDVLYLPDVGPYTRVLSGLTTGQAYFVMVYAVNSQGVGMGQASTPVSEYPRQVPRAPLNVRLDVTRDSMLTVGYDLPLNDHHRPVRGRDVLRARVCGQPHGLQRAQLRRAHGQGARRACTRQAV